MRDCEHLQDERGLERARAPLGEVAYIVSVWLGMSEREPHLRPRVHKGDNLRVAQRDFHILSAILDTR